MKKILVMFTVLLFSAAVNAQTTTAVKSSHSTEMKEEKAEHHSSHITLIMKDGKMWMKEKGKKVDLDKDMSLSNGSTVSPSGLVTRKNGKTMQLKNGDRIDMSGKVTKSKHHEVVKTKTKVTETK